MFLNVYKKSLSKLAGGVMVTGSPFPAACRSRTVLHPNGHERELERV